MTPAVQHVAIPFPQGVRQQLVAHEASVDEHVLGIARRTRRGRQADQAAQAYRSGTFRQGQAGFAERGSENGRHAFLHRLRRQPPDGTAIVRELQRDIRARQRHASEHLFGVGVLGGFGLEKLAACRRVVEQVQRVGHGAVIERRRRGLAECAALALDAPGVTLAGRPAGQREVRDRGDARQGFAAETEARNAFEILERGDLAGGMPRESCGDLGRRDTLAVILDSDLAHAALAQHDRNRACSRIQAVLEQFLEGGSRAFDHFAGGDLVDELVGQDADRSHGTAGIIGATSGAGVHESFAGSVCAGVSPIMARFAGAGSTGSVFMTSQSRATEPASRRQGRDADRDSGRDQAG